MKYKLVMVKNKKRLLTLIAISVFLLYYIIARNMSEKYILQLNISKGENSETEEVKIKKDESREKESNAGQTNGFNKSDLKLNRTTSSHYEEKPERTCEKKYNIFFLKIQKCGSTTFNNILVRFADIHNLSVALPEGDVFGDQIMKNMYPQSKTTNNKYNIFPYHCIFQEKVIRSIMYQDTVYVTLLREPVSRFISHFMWFKKFSPNLRQLSTDQYIKTVLKKKSSTNWNESNKMLEFLGFKRKTLDIKALHSHIEYLDSAFDLVMILEFFEESLILLKHLLCWETDDLVFVVLKNRVKKGNDTFVSHDNRRYLREMSKGDQMLYDFFVKKLKQKIEVFGKTRMKEEISEMRDRLSYWQNHCISQTGSKDNIKTDKIHEHKRTDVNVYKLTERGQDDPVCYKMTIPEAQYRHLMMKKQTEMVQNRYKFPS